MTTTSIKEVARHAGVSLGTVSNVLNRPEVVSEATRQRVLDAIEELGYVRNDSARQLRAGRSRTVGDRGARRGQPVLHRRRPRRRGRRPRPPARWWSSATAVRTRPANAATSTCSRSSGSRACSSPRSTAVPTPGSSSWSAGVPRSCWSTAAPAAATAARSPSTTYSAAGSPASTCVAQGHRRVAFVGGPFSIPQVADRREGFLAAVAGRVEVRMAATPEPDRGRRPPGVGGDRRPGRPRTARPRCSAPTTCWRSACCRR